MQLHSINGNFNEQVFSVIAGNEGFSKTVEHIGATNGQGDHTITLGHGYTFVRGSTVDLGKLETDLSAIGITISDPQKKALGDIAKARASKDWTTTDKLIADFIAGWTAPALTAAQAKTLFMQELETKKGEVRARFISELGATEGAAAYNALAGSWEFLAVMDIGYNAPGLVSRPLIFAIKDGNRAEVWYQLRYNSNKSTQTQFLAGWASRRYLESEMFGLYDPGITAANIGEEASLSIARMWTLHHKEIEAYEKRYGIWDGAYGPDGRALQNASALMRQLGLTAMTGAQELPTVYQEFSPAMDYLIKKYAIDPGYAQADQIGILRVWVGEKSQSNAIGDPDWNSTGSDKADLLRLP